MFRDIGMRDPGFDPDAISMMPCPLPKLALERARANKDGAPWRFEPIKDPGEQHARLNHRSGCFAVGLRRRLRYQSKNPTRLMRNALAPMAARNG